MALPIDFFDPVEGINDSFYEAISYLPQEQQVEILLGSEYKILEMIISLEDGEVEYYGVQKYYNCLKELNAENQIKAFLLREIMKTDPDQKSFMILSGILFKTLTEDKL